MNEIEEKFYTVFNIKPHYIDGCKLADRYWHNEELANEYGTFDQYMKIECPAKYQACTDECKYAFDKGIYSGITDRILLELICILSRYHKEAPYTIYSYSIEEVKEEILDDCITLGNIIKHQVQSLFTEGEE